MKIAVLIPTDDKVPDRCLKSLEGQWDDLEVIINSLKPIKLHDDYNCNRVMNIARNRAILRERALATKADYFLCLDSDTSLPPNAIRNLVRHEKPQVGGWYPHRNSPHFWSTAWWLEKNVIHIARKPIPGLIPTDMSGLGCTMIQRNVLENHIFPSGADRTAVTSDGFRIILGNCMAFATEVKKSNIQIYMDGDVICEHFGDKTPKMKYTPPVTHRPIMLKKVEVTPLTLGA